MFPGAELHDRLFLFGLEPRGIVIRGLGRRVKDRKALPEVLRFGLIRVSRAMSLKREVTGRTMMRTEHKPEPQRWPLGSLLRV
jgi:hypothetical protein